MENKETNKFLELSKLNINRKIEKRKSGEKELSYLSWSDAVTEFSKVYPDFKYEIKIFNGFPYIYDEKTGYMVFTSITVDNQTKDMWLPVMDSNNKAMKNEEYEYVTKKGVTKTVAPATMFEINKTIMRCLVKNMAMFGLGIYIYNGEDLPEKEIVAISEEQIAKIRELGVNEKGVLAYYKINKIEDLSSEQAEEIIRKKSNANKKAKENKNEQSNG